jgi:hypothetical protein
LRVRHASWLNRDSTILEVWENERTRYK